MKKTLYTVCVDNYFPELMTYTFPNLKQYAKKIGADFHVITERKFPEFPPPYEKVQIYELGKENDWNILVDADLLLHPDFEDITLMDPRYIHFHAGYEALDIFTPDHYFLRDGRNRGITTNLMFVSRLCHDIWTPLEFGWDIAKTKTGRLHIIDEYCISRNMAKFGIGYDGVCFSKESQYLIEHFGMMDRSEETIKELLKQAEITASKWNSVLY